MTASFLHQIVYRAGGGGGDARESAYNARLATPWAARQRYQRASARRAGRERSAAAITCAP